MTGNKKDFSRIMTLEVVRVTEAAAMACYDMIGRGDKNAADKAAVDAMRKAFDYLDIAGTVVIGEGEMDEAPMLYIGEKVGTGNGPEVDIAVDPLEGTTLTAHDAPNSICTLAIGTRGSLLHAPDIYMDKIAVGADLPFGIVDLDADPADNIRELAKAKKVSPRDITACLLNRPRHYDKIEKIRSTGARIRLITDGDVAGVINTCDPAVGVDIYMGSGGAPEGVLAAAALRCTGGQMQGRLLFEDEEQKQRALALGITDLHKKLSLEDMAKGEVMFAATGVTEGTMLSGVKRIGDWVTTETIVMRSSSKTVRWIKAKHHRPL